MKRIKLMIKLYPLLNRLVMLKKRCFLYIVLMICIIFCIFFTVQANPVIHEPRGVIIEVVDHYGALLLTDTVTVVEQNKTVYELYGVYNELIGLYPVNQVGIRLKEKINFTNDQEVWK